MRFYAKSRIIFSINHNRGRKVDGAVSEVPVFIMFNIKNYRLGFEFCGFILSLAMLLPSLIWTFVPAPNDILRSTDAILSLGIACGILRALTMLSSMFVINLDCNEPRFNVAAILIFSFGIVYYAGWFLYYAGLACVVALSFISVPPVIMFIALSVDRKNFLSLALSVSFAVVHLIGIILGIISCIG